MVSALLATVPTGYMNAKVKADLDGAVAALKADKSTENYNAVVNAIADATASVTAYANIKAAFDKAEATALSAGPAPDAAAPVWAVEVSAAGAGAVALTEPSAACAKTTKEVFAMFKTFCYVEAKIVCVKL